MTAFDMLMRMFNTRRKSNARYASSLGVFANPDITANIQQYLPPTDRQALVLSSGRNDISDANISVQFEQQQVTASVAAVVQNTLLDTFQGVETLESHVGESNYTWAQNNGGIDYDTAYGLPIQITANGVKIPGVIPGGPTVEFYSSLAANKTIYTLTPSNNVQIDLGWNLISAAGFIIDSAISDGTTDNQIYMSVQGIAFGQVYYQLSATVNGVPFSASFNEPDADGVGSHLLTGIVGAEGLDLYRDGVLVASTPCNLSALPPLGHFYGTAKNNSFAVDNIFVTQFGVTPSSSGTAAIPATELLRGINTPQLKPNLIFDFVLPPKNAISLISTDYTTPASPLQTALNITQGF